jgi:urea carboxylase system permease
VSIEPITAEQQAAKDDAHLQSLGIKPQLQRSLGFLSNFAVAFSYISVSTGTFTLFFLGIGVGGPAFFWAWPIIIIGQTFVALNFAELASHFPVAGSIYQWSKRLSNKTLGWFTGWMYFWAGVLTVTAVAITVPLVLSTILGFKLTDPSPLPVFNNLVFWALVTLVTTTGINAFGVRLLALINNIGVGAEILGLAVFAVILLIFFNHQPLSVLTQTAGVESSIGGNYLPVFLVAMFMALFVVYGFDTAGTFGEETIDASRQAPRGILSAIWLSGVFGAIFLLAIILSFKDMGAAIASGQNFGLPIADTLLDNLGDAGKVYLTVILVAVYVCTLAIQGATTRLMFSMGRDSRLPFARAWAHVHPTFKTPAYAAIAVGILAAIPFLVTDSPAILATGATALIYFAYFLCNLGVFAARRRGWPRSAAWFSLRRWGTVINGLALVWGGAMLINFALWRSDWFGPFGTATYNLADGTPFALRDLTNPLINEYVSIGGSVQSWLPSIPIFEATLGLILVVGAIYYLAVERGRIQRESVEVDAATGEAVIA